MRWAACFDEVEIAPDPVKVPIWQSGRSFDPRYLIKRSASPYDAHLSQLLHPRMPLAENDFTEVDLSLQSRYEMFRFSRRMFTSICAEFGIAPQRPETVLGTSFYDDTFDPNDDNFTESVATSLAMSVGRAQRGRLAPTGFYSRKFRSLAEKDKSFADYLTRNSIDPTRMEALPEFQKAALIRKILSTVVIRDEFLFERGDRMQEPVRARRFRARKRISHIYTGAHSLFAICEGNPRWIIGLLRPLISDFAFNSDRLHLRTIGRALQAKRIERTVSTLIVLLSTLRVEEPVGKSVSIIELIETLGDSCFEQVLGPEFNVEPRLSFVIDEDVQPAVLSAVGRAINQGALVLVPRNLTGTRGKALVTTDPRGINGRRVRLTFLFAPRYRLPLVLGRSVDRECSRFC